VIRCDRAWSALIFHSWQKKERNGNQNPHPEEKQNAEQSVRNLHPEEKQNAEQSVRNLHPEEKQNAEQSVRNPFPEEEKKEADPEQWEADNTQVEHSLMHICK